MIFKRPLRLFTLFPRRFKSLYWSSDSGCLCYTTWWQWGTRHFRVRTRLVLRPYFSDWEELQDRVANEDLDACLIYRLIEIIDLKKEVVTSNLENIYNSTVTQTRNKYQV